MGDWFEKEINPGPDVQVRTSPLYAQLGFRA